MAFSVTVDTTTDPCDICKEFGSLNDPKVYIRESSGGNRNFVTAHVSCLMAKVSAAVTKAAKSR